MILSLQFREKTLAPNPKIFTILVPKLKEEWLGRRSWRLWDLLRFWSLLHQHELIWEHSDHKYDIFSWSMVSILDFDTKFSIVFRFGEAYDSFLCTLMI